MTTSSFSAAAAAAAAPDQQTALTGWQAAVLQAKPGSEQERHAIRGCAEAAANNEFIMRWLRAHPAFAAAADEHTWQAQRKTLEAAVERDDTAPATYADVSPSLLATLLALAAAKNCTNAAVALLKAGALAQANGCAALLAAVDGGQLIMVKLMLAAVLQAARAGTLSPLELQDALARARAAAFPLTSYEVFGAVNAASVLDLPAAAAAAPPPPVPTNRRLTPKKRSVATAAAAASEPRRIGRPSKTKAAKKPRKADNIASPIEVDEDALHQIKALLTVATGRDAPMGASVVRRVLVDVLRERGVSLRTDGWAKNSNDRDRADAFAERLVHAAFGVHSEPVTRGTGRAFALRPLKPSEHLDDDRSHNSSSGGGSDNSEEEEEE